VGSPKFDPEDYKVRHAVASWLLRSGHVWRAAVVTSNTLQRGLLLRSVTYSMGSSLDGYIVGRTAA